MSVAATVRSRVDRSHVGTFFSVGDFPGSSRAVETALSRLVRENKALTRVRKGLYWKGVKSAFGAGRPNPESIVRKLAGGRIGPSGWTASHVLGLSTQMPATPEFAIFGPAPTGIPGVVFHSRWNPKRSKLKYEEVALLEVLREWPAKAETGWGSLVDIVRDLESSDRIRLARVIDAASEERSPRLRDNAEALRSSMTELSSAAAD
jgi:Family of unknown function (DUF6088)